MTIKKLFAILISMTILGTIIHIINSNPTKLYDPIKPDSCSNPINSEQSVTCAELESNILATTVRIELLTWGSIDGQPKQQLIESSHATILEGKYLVTHNHYKFSLAEQVEAFGEREGYTAVSLWSTNGRLLLDKGALNSFSIVSEDAEILVLAFVDDDGLGLFEKTDLPSAKFTHKDPISLEIGDELAQIDWDGETAHVDWVRVVDIFLTDDVPQIRVDNFPLKGSSGGGVFLNGIHVGNIWTRQMDIIKETGEITERYSTVALNSLAIAELEN